MSLSKSILVGVLLLVSLCACSKNSDNEEDTLDLNFELEIIDSIQVDVMESISAMDFNKEQGVVYSYHNNQITKFDSNGKTLNSKIYPKEGPGSLGFVTNLRFMETGEILLYPFGNKLVILDADLEIKKNLEMSFPAELHGAAYFQYMFAVYGEDVFLFYPGRDGGNPYLNNFYKDYKILEKLNLKSGISEASYKLPLNSKYQSELTYDYPTVILSAGNDRIYVALDTESLIHIYDPNTDAPALESLDFEPQKFVQMPGEKSEFVSYYGKIYRGGIKNLFAVPNGVVVHYNEGIESDIYQRESLLEQENWSMLPDFDRQKLKVYQEKKGWSNEIIIPPNIEVISGINDLENSFYGFRHDDYIGEEQDFITFYKLRLVRN